MNTVTKLLKEAWELRQSRNLEECRRIYRQLKHLIPASPLNENATSLALLHASLLRADGKTEESAKKIAELELFLQNFGESIPFQLPFQKALNFFQEALYSEALDLFVSAKNIAVEPLDVAFAAGNALLCLENLGLPCLESARELQQILSTCAEGSTKDVIVSLLEAFHLRHAFRYGKFSDLTHSNGTLSTYYLLWLSQLPYHLKQNQGMELSVEELAKASPSFYVKSYRLRTLIGVVHEEDLSRFLPKEFADRLYLWTWRWLTEPETTPTQMLMRLLENVKLKELLPKMTHEDFQLVRNSLLWLILFSPGKSATLLRLLSSLRPNASNDFPLLEFERLTIEFLKHARDKDQQGMETRLASLKSHPLWTSETLLFRALVDGKGSLTPMERLARSIENLLQEKIPTREAPILIDLSNDQIRFFEKDPLISRSICRALELFCESVSPTLAEFASAAFDFARFEEEIHRPKIANLLSQMNRLFPRIRFQIRNGRVYSSGSLEGITFLRPPIPTELLNTHPSWIEFLSATARRDPKPSTAKSALVDKLRSKAEWTRQELQDLLGKSRSSVLRAIEQWTKDGLLKPIGRGKRKKYSLCLEEASCA